jgi:hypothetical protein
MKKLFPIVLMIFGLVFVGASAYTVHRGFDAKDQVRAELTAQDITTPSDASLPNRKVTNVATAQSMADIIDHHALDASGGLTYSQMGRFASKTGDAAGTDDATAALLGADGKPVSNPIRNVAFQASALRTSLYASIMAFNIADLVVGLGLMMLVLGASVGGVGVALGGLAIPSLARRVHVEPIAAHEM